MRPEICSGAIEGERVRETRSLFGAVDYTGRDWLLSDVRLLAPVEPSKIVCVGRNYAEHAAELGNEVPREPLIFLKPPSSVIGPDEPILLPEISKRVDYEGEIAVVIGELLHRPGDHEALERFILGYTCLNDVTARDIQKRDVQFTRGKSFDTFCPIGPAIETEFNLASASVETRLNGDCKQIGHTSEMLFSVEVIIRWVARVMTLHPGDVIATGTPPGIGPLAAGDVVEVIVSGIGSLRNPVAVEFD
ncbi:MAG TPA: fumarylacetoacetate hydrolase family protein [Candidatus Acidoferrales bacterium]|nr:fumarylacetoacetate hydrolase family protein [Candidatus Acidoferrales bacterium]